jgi:hypothetical protein
MQYSTILGIRHWQTYVLNLSNNLIRRVFTRNLFISSKLYLNVLSKLSLKSPKTALLVLALLLLSSSWDVQANGKKARAGNRSDAIILPSPVINYVRPTLYLGSGDFVGPADIWDPRKGFLVQSINPELYNLNFPTTGAHNLYFDLLITGIEPEELTWAPVTHEGITATVTNVAPYDGWIPFENWGKVVARVTLTGPEARNQQNNPNPIRITVPRLPQTFELVGRDINTGDEIVKYGFSLKQWFVNRPGNQYEPYSDQLAWCNSLGYRMPRVRDLTNAVRTDNPPISGATPLSSKNNYQRQIGAGLFTEWGPLHSYKPDTGFCSYCCYWTSDAASSRQFHIIPNNGHVYGGREDCNGYYSVCTIP